MYQSATTPPEGPGPEAPGGKKPGDAGAVDADFEVVN
jgi:hypothetical protein